MLGTLKRALSVRNTRTRTEVVNPETGCKGAVLQQQGTARYQPDTYDGPDHTDKCKCLTNRDVSNEALMAHINRLLEQGLIGPAEVGVLMLKLVLRLPVVKDLELDRSLKVKLPPGEVFPLRLERDSKNLESFPALDESDL